ncbi:MAG: LysR family transcriptional regulator [Pseudomonas sp.]|uniref:LysR family transcriptional regulator n=1 Tax=Pseudomonas sp. TaxID=306 RepID=UPI003982B52F
MESTYSLDDMRLFWAVAHYGSYKQASTVLHVPLSTLSRRVSRLESDLGLRLLHRDSHRVTLTATGQHYFDRCAPLFSELNDIASQLQADKQQPKGKIRISAPINLTSFWLGQLFNDFLALYPQIDLDLSLSNTPIDIQSQFIDIAFRAGNATIENWIARPLVNLNYLLCCASKQVQWHDLKHPNQLTELPLIVSKPIFQWSMRHRPTNTFWEEDVSAQAKLAVDNMDVALNAIIAGLGIGLLPSFLVTPLIRQGVLTQLAPDWQGSQRSVYMLYRDRDNIPGRMRLLIDFIIQRFAEQDVRMRFDP